MGLPPGGSVEVADPQLCNLDVPEEVELTTCPAGTNNAGALVTNATLCEAPNDDNICPAGTNLEGVYVEDPTTDCTIFAICPATSNLPGVNVTDTRLCNAATPAVQCPAGTDLFGVWVNSTAQSLTLSCNISANDITNNLGAQCLKCGDLSVFATTGNAGQMAAATIVAAGELRG